MTAQQVAARNPNATLAAGSTSIGVVLIYVGGLFGWNPEPAVAAALSGIFTSFLLYIGHSGVKGFFVMLWRGSGGRVT